MRARLFAVLVVALGATAAEGRETIGAAHAAIALAKKTCPIGADQNAPLRARRDPSGHWIVWAGGSTDTPPCFSAGADIRARDGRIKCMMMTCIIDPAPDSVGPSKPDTH